MKKSEFELYTCAVIKDFRMINADMIEKHIKVYKVYNTRDVKNKTELARTSFQ